MHATVHYFHFSFFSSKEEQERRSKLEKELEDARSDIKVKAVHIAFTQSTFWKASICEWCLLALFTVYVWKCKMWDLIFMIYDKWLEKHVLFGLHHKCHTVNEPSDYGGKSTRENASKRASGGGGCSTPFTGSFCTALFHFCLLNP